MLDWGGGGGGGTRANRVRLDSTDVHAPKIRSSKEEGVRMHMETMDVLVVGHNWKIGLYGIL